MRRMFVFLSALLLLALPLFAKANTAKIVITGANLRVPIQITDAKTLETFNVWSGLGTSSSQPRSFIVDWSQGPISDRPTGLPRYQISFFARLPKERLIYVVFYEYDASAKRGYAYLPGKGEHQYSVNAGTILRGKEGSWFSSWNVWDNVAIPLLSGNRER